MTVAFIAVILLSCFRTAGGQETAKNPADCSKIINERDNLLIQLRNMRGYKDKVAEMETAYKKAVQERDAIKQELAVSSSRIAGLEQKLDLQASESQQKSADLQAQTDKLSSEKDSLKNSLERWEIEYKILPETRKVISRLEREKKEAEKNLLQQQVKVKQMEEEKLNQSAQVEIYRRQIKELKKSYEGAMNKNRALEKDLEQLPLRFAEVSRQNKVLIKETALMHYNLGVFYTKNKEYSRAIAEFEKTIELNPDDPYAHYNLGYIYAEYMVDRPKAIEQFRKFLQLCKTEDSDVDWVKKYILTWETWSGKKPVK